MAIALSGTIASAVSNTSGTTIATTFTAAQSGKFSILCLAYDPTGNAVPTVTVADGQSNTWTSLGAYSAPATTSAGTGLITQIFTSTTATSATTTTVTATFSAAITGKVARLFTFTGTNGATGIVRNTVRGTAQDLTSSLTSVASGDLVLAWGAWEQTGTVTATSTTTSGTWAPSNTSVTAVSSGGTGAANILGYYQYKITTATATQAHTVQNNTSGNCALQYIKVLQLAATTRTASGSGAGSSSATGYRPTLRDSQNAGHSDAIAAVSIPPSSPWSLYETAQGGSATGFSPVQLAQQFTATTSSTIDRVELIVSYSGGTSAGKTISVSIASDDIVNGNNPPDPIPGTVIATSNSILETTIGSNASNNWISFTFPSAVSLTSGTKYWIIVNPDPTSTTASVGVLYFTNYAYNGFSGDRPSVGTWNSFSNSDPTSSFVMDFKVIRRNATGSIVSSSTKQRTASGSGAGSNGSVTFVETLFRTASGSGLGSATTTHKEILSRTASGSGLGGGSASSIELLPRTATGTGTGSTSGGATGLHTAPRTAIGSGAGASTATGSISLGSPIHNRTADGTGTGAATVVSLHIAPRTASGSGAGSATSSGNRIKARSAIGTGAGSNGTVTPKRVRLRTATGTGTGSNGTVTRRITAKRTSTGVGFGSGLTIQSIKAEGINWGAWGTNAMIR